jgi:hypothetical protein
MFVAGLGSHAVTTWLAVQLWVTLTVGVVVLRAAARALWRRIVPQERAVLVGSGALETATLRKLELFEDIHVRCVAVIGDSDADPHGDSLEQRIVDLGDIDRVIVASMHVTEAAC